MKKLLTAIILTAASVCHAGQSNVKYFDEPIGNFGGEIFARVVRFEVWGNKGEQIVIGPGPEYNELWEIRAVGVTGDDNQLIQKCTIGIWSSFLTAPMERTRDRIILIPGEALSVTNPSLRADRAIGLSGSAWVHSANVLDRLLYGYSR